MPVAKIFHNLQSTLSHQCLMKGQVIDIGTGYQIKGCSGVGVRSLESFSIVFGVGGVIIVTIR